MLLGLILGLGAYAYNSIRYAGLSDAKIAQSAHFVRALYGGADTLLGRPAGIAFNDKDELIAADTQNNRVLIFGGLDRLKQNISPALQMQRPADIAYRDGLIYASDRGTNTVYSFDEQGNFKTSYVFEDASPLAIALAPDGANIYVATEKGIYFKTAHTGDSFMLALKSQGEGLISALAIGPKQKLYLAQGDTLYAYQLDQNHAGMEIFVPDGGGSLLWKKEIGRIGGIALNGEGNKLYISNAEHSSITILNAPDGLQLFDFGKTASGEERLSSPQAIAYNNGAIAVADRLNSRIVIFDDPSDERTLQPEVLGVSAALTYLPPALLLLASLVLALIALFLRPSRYSFDANFAELYTFDPNRPLLEDETLRVKVAAQVEEFAQRAFFDVGIEAIEPSEKIIEILAEKYPDLDRLDLASLALAKQLGSSHIFATASRRLHLIAQELKIRVISYEAFRAIYNPVGLGDIDEPVFALKEPKEDEVRVRPYRRALKTAPILLLVLVLAGALVFIASKNGMFSYFASGPLAKHQYETVKVSEILSRSLSKDEQQSYFYDKGFEHEELFKDCTLCHKNKQHEFLFKRSQAPIQACEACHDNGSNQAFIQSYTEAIGGARGKTSKSSGHTIGLKTWMPASTKERKAFELNCLSCHFVHNPNATTLMGPTGPLIPSEEATASLLEAPLDLNLATKKSCIDCHDDAEAPPEKRGLLGFSLSDELRAHKEVQGLYKKGHAASQETCVRCHRGNLDPGKDCAVCHYSQADFDNDPKRAAHTSDWPHASAGDRALLGNWKTEPKKDSFSGIVTSIVSAPLSIYKESANLPSSAHKAGTYCSRCHISANSKEAVMSLHDRTHDPLLGVEVPLLDAPLVGSIIETTSPGYQATGKYAGKRLSMLVSEVGERGSTYTDVPCLDCHLSNVAAEHQLRSNKGCLSCHIAGADNKPTDLKEGVEAKSFISCGTEEAACHARDWHGYRRDEVIEAHSLSKRETESGFIARGGGSCSRSVDGIARCHSMQSRDSLFFFGDMDLASAHNDYWSALNETHINKTDYLGSIEMLDDVRGCTLCHSANVSSIEMPGSQYLAHGETSITSCASCHTDTKKPYAERECLRVAKPRSDIASVEETDALSVSARGYLSELKERQEAARKSAASARSKASQGVIIMTEQTEIEHFITPGFMPVSRMLPINSELSVMGIHLGPHGTVMEENFFKDLLIDVK